MQYTTLVDSHMLRPLGYHAPDSGLSLPYFQREFERIGASVKQDQREKIIRFILDHHSFDDFRHMRFFGFPGPEWYFENMLWHDWTYTRPKFIGVERLSSVQDYARRFMPGGRPEELYFPMAHGEIRGWANSYSKAIHFHAEHFWALEKTDMLDLNEFRQQFANWTCAWIDPFCSLTGRFFDSMYLLPGMFGKTYEACPLVISFQLGRDQWTARADESSMDPRIEGLTAQLNKSWHRTFEVINAFTHRRDSQSATMGTVMGLSRLRKSPKTEEKKNGRKPRMRCRV